MLNRAQHQISKACLYSSVRSHTPDVAHFATIAKNVASRPGKSAKSRSSRLPVRLDAEGQKVHRLGPQKPYYLALKVQSLAKEGNLEKAVQMVKDSSLDSQNTILWNTLMQLAIKDNRMKYAFDLFNDMKRRGFKANYRTYCTLLVGFSDGTHVLSPKQVERAQSVFDQYSTYSASVKASNPSSSELGNTPVNCFLKILERSGNFQKMFDVFYSMEKEGPLAPDHITFTVMINALGRRKTLHTGGGEAPKGGEVDVNIRNASDVKFLWRQMVKAHERGIVPMDSHAIAATLYVLGKGSPTDQLLAFGIVQDYLGLSKPGEPRIPPQVHLSKQVVAAVLALCNNTRKFRLTLHFSQLIMDSPQRGVLLLNHMNQVLSAYASLSSIGSLNEAGQALETIQWMLRQEIIEGGRKVPLRPDIESFHLGLLACWRGGDWQTALKFFEMMTGYSASDFSKPLHTLESRPRPAKRSNGRSISPNAETMSLLARTALASRTTVSLRECLRIASHFGASFFFVRLPKSVTTPPGDVRPAITADTPYVSRSEVKHLAFHQHKLALALIDLVETVSSRDTKIRAESASSPESPTSLRNPPPSLKSRSNDREMIEWQALATRALDVLSQLPASKEEAPEKYAPTGQVLGARLDKEERLSRMSRSRELARAL